MCSASFGERSRCTSWYEAPMNRLTRDTALLTIIDVQERMMPVIDRRADVEQNVERLIRGCHVLGIPILLTEQYTKGLGVTVEPIRRALDETSGYTPIEKSCFSSYGCGKFQEALRAQGRRQI